MWYEKGIPMKKGYRDEIRNEWRECCIKAVSDPYGVSLWRSIRQEWETFFQKPLV